MVLQNCGIDSEKISRFATVALCDDHPFPFVFSQTEFDHCRGLENPAKGLCACFCCKEALRKAINAPYNYPDFEALFDERTRTVVTRTAQSLKSEFGVEEIMTEVMDNSLDTDELIVVVAVLSKKKST